MRGLDGVTLAKVADAAEALADAPEPADAAEALAELAAVAALPWPHEAHPTLHTERPF